MQTRPDNHKREEEYLLEGVKKGDAQDLLSIQISASAVGALDWQESCA